MAGSFEVGVLSGKILLGDFVTIALANPPDRACLADRCKNRQDPCARPKFLR